MDIEPDSVSAALGPSLFRHSDVVCHIQSQKAHVSPALGGHLCVPHNRGCGNPGPTGHAEASGSVCAQIHKYKCIYIRLYTAFFLCSVIYIYIYTHYIYPSIYICIYIYIYIDCNTHTQSERGDFQLLSGFSRGFYTLGCSRFY